MTKQFAKFGSVFAGVAMALSFASPVGAVTVAELQAQINALMAQLATLQGGSSVSTTFTTDLTIGSKGDQVSALQQALVSKGFLTMPAGVAYGYFGNLTKSAVAAWQAANGITPAVGYFGPKSRAAFGGAVAGTPGTPSTPATPGSTGITTPGVEGTLTVTTGTVSNSTVYADDNMAPVLSFKAKAQNSDIAIQRIKLDLAGSSNVYTKAFTKVYLVDEAGTTVASSDLNSSTVVKDNSVYYITLAGFSSIVPKDTTKTFTVKMDVDNSITAANYVIRLAASGVRGIDGAGIDQYSPAAATDVSKTISVAASLADSAEFTLSTAANTPLDQEVVAADGAANNQADKVSLLSFDVRASKDNITVTDLVATVTSTGAATASSTYLYVGDTLVGTASLSTNTATFSDMSVAIAKDTTKTFTLKTDIASADSTQTTIDASIAASGITAENSASEDVTTKTGSAAANNTLVRNVGPQITLGTHPLVRDSGTIGIANGTSTASATFSLTIKAVGSDIWFGTQAASTTFAFGIHSAGADAATVLAASSTSWSVPTGANTSDNATGQSFKIAEGATVTIPVTFLFEGRLASGALLTTGSYAVGLSSVAWSDTKLGTAKSSTFMANKTEWRSNTVTMP